MNTLKQRCKNYLNTFQTPTTKFCKRISLSYSGFYKWLRGDYELSAETQRRIDNFLSGYGF